MATESKAELRYPKIIGLLLVLASVLIIIALFVLDLNVIYEPPLLLPFTNTIFTAIIPIIVAVFAARTYLKSGSLSVLLMGCGMLSFGVSAALAGWLRPVQHGANINVTVYNTGALAGALFHIAGAALSSFWRAPQRRFENGKLIATSLYCSILAFIILFTFATFEGVISPFFIQGKGPTALRQIVLGLAIFLYFLSANLLHGPLSEDKIGFLLLVLFRSRHAGVRAVCLLHPERRREPYRLGGKSIELCGCDLHPGRHSNRDSKREIERIDPRRCPFQLLHGCGSELSVFG